MYLIKLGYRTESSNKTQALTLMGLCMNEYEDGYEYMNTNNEYSLVNWQDMNIH